ncbi:MAG: hypothetical protein C4K49_06100 [Candidatus Thorarchaeota archaeon]|nr:MAG: hypothetical protein C4K49_06100 [Candidatus Thorarchaeota archaeon]
MVGIVGVLGRSCAANQSEMLKQMSLAIIHRGDEKHVRCLSSEDGFGGIAVRSRLDCDHSIHASQDGVTVLDHWNASRFVDGRGDIPFRFTDETDPDSSPDVDPRFLDTLLVSIGETEFSSMRSTFSMKPLYYQCKGPDFVFSTERKAIWRLGLNEAAELQPGQLLRVIAGRKPSSRQRERMSRPDTGSPPSHREVIQNLSTNISGSFRRLRSLRNVGVLFSGGVDSSLAAILTRDVCKNVILIAACAEKSHDDRLTSEVADRLGMDLLKVRIDAAAVWEILPELIYAVESSRQLDIEVALPFYLAARQAHDAGLSVVISGQGPDELFAGYARYVETFIREGEVALDNQLWNDVIATHRNNIERDERAIEYNQVSAFFPYLDSRFIVTAMSIPSSWKVAQDAMPDRKLVFRELAQEMGLPVEIANAPKKATQYSSGSRRAIAMAVRANARSKNDSSTVSGNNLVQGALNKIASEIGIPLVGSLRRNLMVDLTPTMRLVERIRKV